MLWFVFADEVVVVNWESIATSRKHTGKFPVAWLEENNYSDVEHQATLSAEREPKIAVGCLCIYMFVHVFVSFCFIFQFS